MLEHSSAGRCILIAAMALFGAAAVHAAPNNSPAKDTTGKDASPAISLDQLGGTWKNAKSGVNVRIEQSTVGWEVWFSTTGEARITLPEKNRPAIKIDGRNFTCSYSVTLPTSQSMKWDLTQGKPESQCLTGVFSRVAPAPEAKQVGRSKRPQLRAAATRSQETATARAGCRAAAGVWRSARHGVGTNDASARCALPEAAAPNRRPPSPLAGCRRGTMAIRCQPPAVISLFPLSLSLVRRVHPALRVSLTANLGDCKPRPSGLRTGLSIAAAPRIA